MSVASGGRSGSSGGGTPRLVRAMIAKGGAYLLLGVVVFPGVALFVSSKFGAVLAVLATFFSLAAALGFFASRSGTRNVRLRGLLVLWGVVSLAVAVGQGAYGVRALMNTASQPGVQPSNQLVPADGIHEPGEVAPGANEAGVGELGEGERSAG